MDGVPVDAILLKHGDELAHLPTFQAMGIDRLKRLTMLVDQRREVRAILYPIADPAGSVDDALALVMAGGIRGDSPKTQ